MDEVDYRVMLDQLLRTEGVGLSTYRDEAGNLIVAPDHHAERMGVRGTGLAVLEVDVRASPKNKRLWPITGKLDEVRQRALIHMAFNLRSEGC